MSEIEDDPGPCVCTDCQNAREQGTSETAGPEQRQDHTRVIRPADEAEARFERYRVALREVILDVIDGENSTEDDCADDVAKEAMALADAEHAALIAEVAASEAEWQAECDARDQDFTDSSAEVERLTAEVAAGMALVVDLQTGLVDALAEVARLRGGREIEQTMLANVLSTLAANGAENEALRAEVESLRAFQMQPRAETTNTPHNDPEFGFDKTAALSEPTPWCGCHICTRHGQIKSKP